MIGKIKDLYDDYVDGYRGADGCLPVMMQLKYEHTAFVVRNAGLIADGESFDLPQRQAALVAAQLHDVGRYEQLRRYNTFRDSESVDHAVFSHDIVREKGWLDSSFDAICPGFAEIVLKAVLYHNRRDLPSELDAPGDDPFLRRLTVAAHTVRDADKLDIFRVLEDQVAHTDWRHDSRAFWNLSTTGAPNPEVVRAILESRPVDYQHILTLADFVLIQVGWMRSGLHFATSRRLCRERGHLEYRRRFLHEITDSPEVDRVCDSVVFPE